MLDWYTHLSLKTHVLIFFGLIWFNGLLIGASALTVYWGRRFRALHRQVKEIDQRIKEANEFGEQISGEQAALRKALGFSDATSDVWDA